MPCYEFHCRKCKKNFEDICSFEERKNTKCPDCQSEVENVLTMPGAVIFTNPKGTSMEDKFDYVAKYNYERAQLERRAAQEADKLGNMYKPIDDMPNYEGKIV